MSTCGAGANPLIGKVSWLAPAGYFFLCPRCWPIKIDLDIIPAGGQACPACGYQRPSGQAMTDEERNVFLNVSAVRTEGAPMELELRLDTIRPGRWQPRQQFDPEKMLSLAQSIQAQGLINPVIVFADEAGTYELIAGERRWRASIALAMANRGELQMDLETAAGLVCRQDPVELLKQYFFLAGYSIRADKRPAGSPERLHQVAIVDNLQRHDLSRLEEAQALQALKEENGYSIRKLAEVCGLTKSYVEDSLKLLGLAPEVAEMATAKNGSGPAIDLTLARDLARKLPAEMQPAVADYLTFRQANSPMGAETVKKGQAAISRVAAFLDPERWVLPEDRTWKPEVRNRSRLIRHLLATMDRTELAGALVKLDQPMNSWDPSGYLGKKPLDLLESSYEYWRMIGVLRINGNWGGEPEVVAQGWTCGNCQLQHLVDLFFQRSPDLDRSVPCKRFLADPAEVHTCEQFVGPDDPTVIEIGSLMASYLAGEPALKELSRVGSSPYTDTPLKFHALYTAARQEKERRDEAQERRARESFLGPMRGYWQAQQDGTSLSLDHFQAHACQKCFYCQPDETDPNDPSTVPCKFSREPLRHDYGDRENRAPEYRVLKAGDVTVPRCEKFRFRFLPEFAPPKKAGFVIPDRDLVLGWYKQLTRSTHYYSNRTGIWKPLQWLPASDTSADGLKKFWRGLGSDDMMMAILQAGVLEYQTITEYGSQSDLLDPTTGQVTRWHAEEFRPEKFGQGENEPAGEK